MADAWVLETVEEKPVEAKFRPTLVARAKKRTVNRYGDDWMVDGDRGLGDSRRLYLVRLNHETKRYDCDCYHSDHGEQRKKKVCSHVLAVLLFRQAKGGTTTSLAGSANPAYVSQTVGQEEPSSPQAAPPRLDVPSVDDVRFGSPPLPIAIESIRPHQWDAVEEVLAAYDGGAEVVWLDGPTGTGKTLIAELVRRVMGKRALYVCSSKTLQDQFAGDYDYAQVIKGRSNYPTELMTWPDYTAADCGQALCLWCSSTATCPYQVAKRSAMRANIAILNTSYFLAEANYVGDLKGDFVILDECDVLEKELMGFVEFNVGGRTLSDLGVRAPKKGSHKETIRSWLATELSEAIGVALKGSVDRLSDVQRIRRTQRLQSLRAKARQVAKQWEDDADEWVRDNDAGPMVLKPVSVAPYAEEALWRHGKRWLCMSATLISTEELSASLGLEGKKQVTVRVPMTFPVENRRINLAPIANMVAKEKDNAWPAMARAIRSVMALHNAERILVHTVSYDLARYLHGELADTKRTLTYTSAGERDRALSDFRASPGMVLLAPSLDRGVDLRGEACRVVIVAKVPYPSLGDKQVSARLHTEGGQAWYTVQTIRSLVQMTGRGVRSEDDWCVSYILDKQMVSSIWKKNRHLLPEWWREAVNTQFPTRTLV